MIITSTFNDGLDLTDLLNYKQLQHLAFCIFLDLSSHSPKVLVKLLNIVTHSYIAFQSIKTVHTLITFRLLIEMYTNFITARHIYSTPSKVLVDDVWLQATNPCVFLYEKFDTTLTLNQICLTFFASMTSTYWDWFTHASVNKLNHYESGNGLSPIMFLRTCKTVTFFVQSPISTSSEWWVAASPTAAYYRQTPVPTVMPWRTERSIFSITISDTPGEQIHEVSA